MFVIKEELDHFKEKSAKIVQIFYSKRAGKNLQKSYRFSIQKGQVRDQDPEEIQLFRLRIRPVQKVPDSQHWLQMIRIQVFGEFGSSPSVL
jgi:hypothetical protein